jgi:4'-phosphopantetheinyl transferase
VVPAADRFLFAHDRERFVAARSGLRRILGRYLGCPADAVAFRLGSHGKPALDHDEPPLSFNLSHSGDLALLAVVRRGEVGVDVEREQATIDVESMAARWFSAAEQRALLALPPEARAAAFFRGWTRKESYIKAHGEGLSLPLDRFTVSLDEGAHVGFTCDDPAEAGRWWLCALPIDVGYAAALTVEGGPTRVDLYDMS